MFTRLLPTCVTHTLLEIHPALTQPQGQIESLPMHVYTVLSRELRETAEGLLTLIIYTQLGQRNAPAEHCDWSLGVDYVRNGAGGNCSRRIVHMRANIIIHPPHNKNGLWFFFMNAARREQPSIILSAK